MELAAAIVRSLIQLGTEHVVLAPGSRNAPLSLALHAADQAGELRLHVRVDERVAGFTALGLAKASVRPVAVVTTSGTATANLAPAAMEARETGVALLVLTADRPGFLSGSGANQTGRQVGILGPSALDVVRLNSESGTPQQVAGAVARAWATASGYRDERPGPVQINLEFAPPLVGPVPDVEVRVPQFHIASMGNRVPVSGEGTVVMVGDAREQTGAIARITAEYGQVPLFAEPSSNARSGPNAIARYRELMGSELVDQIRRVVQFGHPTLSRPQAALLANSDVELIVVSDGGRWSDAGANAAMVVEAVEIEPAPEGWLDTWQDADRAALPSGPSDSWDGETVARVVLETLTEDDAVFWGSSNTIRYADLAPIPDAAPAAFANRGLAGIDGTVATATGIALAYGPTTVVLGDLSLQHDLGALVRPAQEPEAHLRIVVIDDDGGAIFAGLEQGAPEYADSFERVFGTPQNLDLAAILTALGWRTEKAHSAAELRAALASDAQAIVCPVVR